MKVVRHDHKIHAIQTWTVYDSRTALQGKVWRRDQIEGLRAVLRSARQRRRFRNCGREWGANLPSAAKAASSYAGAARLEAAPFRKNLTPSLTAFCLFAV